MNFKDIFKWGKKNEVEERHANQAFDWQGLTFGRSSYTNDYAMKLSTVYRCVNCISDAVAQLPMEIFKVDKKGYKVKDRKNPAFGILNAKPNKRMTRYTFISLLVQSMLLKGNAYAYIVRNEKGNVEQLIYIPADYVTIVTPKNIFEPIKYRITGFKNAIESKDLIHILNQSYDGVIGISTLHFARQTLGLAFDSEKHASNFFSTGCAVAGFIKSDSSLTPKQKQEIKNGFRNAFGKDNGETNGVAVLEGSLSYQPITINPVDAQLLETRQFNVIDICRFFGVSPVKAFDLSKSSYSTVEATNISFLTDTLSALLEKIELEFETKLFGNDCSVDIRFDVSQILRADRQSLANYYSTMFNIGAISINEIRKEIDLPSVQKGDANFVQVNLQTLERATSETPDNAETIKEKLND